MGTQQCEFPECLDQNLEQLDNLDNIDINLQQLEEFIVNESKKQQDNNVSNNLEFYAPTAVLSQPAAMVHTQMRLPESPPDSCSDPYSPPQYEVAVQQPHPGNVAPLAAYSAIPPPHPAYRCPNNVISPPVSVSNEQCDPVVKKRRFSDTIKQELDTSPGSSYGPEVVNVNNEVIKWQNFQTSNWTKVYDQNHFEIPLMSFKVDADKGFNYSVSDESFVCQKKNHFQVTVHTGFHGEPHYLKDVDGQLKLIDHFALHFNGVKMESLNQEIKIEQSQSNRSKRAFHPVRVDNMTSQVTKMTVGRLHFSETTTNNMRKKGKPNPDQRYLLLVVKICAHLVGSVDCCLDSSMNFPVIAANVSEKIIVRASNPGQFDTETDQTWQKAGDNNVFHIGKVSVNTDRADEALTVHGNLKVTGQVVQPSDQRVKTDIKELDTMKQLENIQQLKVYNYKYGDDFANYAGMANVDRQDTGVLAQELSQVLPDAVRSHGDIILPSGNQINDFQVVNKDRIYMENVGAVKQLCKVTDKLENRIYELESLNRMLTKMNTGLLRNSMKSSLSLNAIDASGFKRSLSQKKHNSEHHRASIRSLSSGQAKTTTKDKKSKPVCSNRFIHIAIFISVLIMSFCVILITILYAFDKDSKDILNHHYMTARPKYKTTIHDRGDHSKTINPIIPSRCKMKKCQQYCCLKNIHPSDGKRTNKIGHTPPWNSTSPIYDANSTQTIASEINDTTTTHSNQIIQHRTGHISRIKRSLNENNSMELDNTVVNKIKQSEKKLKNNLLQVSNKSENVNNFTHLITREHTKFYNFTDLLDISLIFEEQVIDIKDYWKSLTDINSEIHREYPFIIPLHSEFPLGAIKVNYTLHHNDTRMVMCYNSTIDNDCGNNKHASPITMYSENDMSLPVGFYQISLFQFRIFDKNVKYTDDVGNEIDVCDYMQTNSSITRVYTDVAMKFKRDICSQR